MAATRPSLRRRRASVKHRRYLARITGSALNGGASGG